MIIICRTERQNEQLEKCVMQFLRSYCNALGLEIASNDIRVSSLWLLASHLELRCVQVPHEFQ